MGTQRETSRGIRASQVIGLLVLCAANGFGGQDEAAGSDLQQVIDRTLSEQGLEALWQVGTPFDGVDGAWQAPNRRGGLRTFFLEEGIRVAPFAARTDGWALGLSLAGLARGEHESAAHAAQLVLEGARAEYRRGNVTEWYVNEERGLEQGFDIASPPLTGRADGAALELVLAEDRSELPTRTIEATQVTYRGAEGAVALRLSQPYAFDATGRELPVGFSQRGGRLTIVVQDAGAVYPITVDPILSGPEAELHVTGVVNNARFGSSVALDGERAVVTAPGPVAGAAYLFQKNAGDWELELKITPPDGHTGQDFGTSVVLRDDLLAIGARSDSEAAIRGGAVYVYRFDADEQDWDLERKVFAQHPEQEGHFGQSLAFDDGWLMIGAPGENATAINSGAVYMFAHVGGLWQAYQKFIPQSAETHQYFGTSVTVDEDVALIGAPGQNDDPGAAFVYRWREHLASWGDPWQTLEQSGSAAFGHALAYDAPWLVVGAPRTGQAMGTIAVYYWGGTIFGHRLTKNGAVVGREYGSAVAVVSNATTGLAELFTTAPRSGDADQGRAFAIPLINIAQAGASQHFDDPEERPGAQFGTSLAASREDLIVGSRWSFAGNVRSGAALAYERPSDEWTLASRVVPTDASDGDNLGYAVALSGDVAVVGAPGDEDSMRGAGAAYVFERENGEWIVRNRLTEGIHAQNGSRFGSSVDIDGDLIAVGAPDYDWEYEDAGASFTFGRSFIGTWNATGRQLPVAVTREGHFGASVAVHGERLAVGAPNAHSTETSAGVVETFTRNILGTWNNDTLLLDPRAGSAAGFGERIAFDGPFLVVGAPHASVQAASSGAAFVFELVGETWSGADMLEGDGSALERFGSDVDLDGGRLAVSSLGHELANGTIRLFERSAGTWHQTDLLRSPVGDGDYGFGGRIDLSGDVLVTCPSWYNGDSVYAFQRAGSLWESTLVELPPNAAQDAVAALRVDGSRLLVGAPGAGPAEGGAAYVFDLPVPSPFQPFGFGDGSVRPCPCGNDSPQGADEGCVNSTGAGARLRATGSASLSADDMLVTADQIPPGRSTQLFIGRNRLLGLAFGDGLRIATVPFIRIALQQSSGTGSVTWSELHGTGFWGPGDVRYFQAFYRDPGGPCGSGFNVTNAVQVVFEP